MHMVILVVWRDIVSTLVLEINKVVFVHCTEY
jgi:hypothetical protein